MEDLWATSGQHQEGGASIHEGVTGVEKLRGDRVRETRQREATKNKMKKMKKRRRRRSGKESSRYTEQRGCSMCHIRTGGLYGISAAFCVTIKV